MKKKVVMMLLVVGMVFNMVACAKPVDSVETGTEKELIIGMVGDVTVWNPYEKNEVIANSIQRHVFEGLIEIAADLSSQPALAESWLSNEDASVWTFKLRQGVKFHNGNDFNANDVIFSLDTCRETNKGWVDAMATIESYTAVDEYTVQINCLKPDAILPAAIRNIAIIDQETCKGKGLEFLETEEARVGTGKYNVKEYTRDDKLVLERNENYWGTKPEATKVTFRTIPNDGTRTASIMAQEVDMIGNVPVRDAEMLKAKEFLTVVSEPSMGVMFYNLAQTKENPSKDAKQPIKSPDGSNPLFKKEVRQAIMHAINNQELVDVVMNGYATVAPTLIPKGFNGYNSNIKHYDYDTTKAGELLDAAGYPKQADGYRFEITLDATNDRYINDGAAATSIAGYLDKVGIKCNVNLMSRASFFGYIRTYDDGGDNTHFLQSGWSDPSGESVDRKSVV